MIKKAKSPTFMGEMKYRFLRLTEELIIGVEEETILFWVFGP